MRDLRFREYVVPTRVLWQQGQVEGARALVDCPTVQATVWRNAVCQLPAGGAVLLDFGRELHGGIQIVAANTPGNAPTLLRVRLGESASEAMGEPNNDHAIHDQQILVPWMGSTEIGNTGFRFARLDAPAGISLQAVRAVSLMREIPPVGSFECSDDRLNQVWAVAARTVHLCMQDHLWDGIKRDRLVWMGDLFPEVMAVSTVFGHQAIVAESLDLVRDETFPVEKWMNGMPSYSLWWILIQRSWYFRQGDAAYLRAQKDYLRQLMPAVLKLVGEDGCERIPEPRFLDWQSAGDIPAIHVGLQGLLAMALGAASDLCDILELPRLSRQCKSAHRRMTGYVPPHTDNKGACALLALGNLADAGRINRNVLRVHPNRGLSPFAAYSVLEARILAGDLTGALNLVRHYWGGMLDLGATSFWEHFDVDWMQNAGRIDELPTPGVRDIHRECGSHCYQGLRHSLCHGWAAGVATWLSDAILGVRALKPGYSTVRIDPALGGLKWARGTIPTPLGPIMVVCERCRGSSLPAVSLSAPVEIHIVHDD